MLSILLGVRNFLLHCFSAQDEAHSLHRSYVGSEDCLFLNVYAPQHGKDLPVFVFIRMSLTTCVLVHPETTVCLQQASCQTVGRTKLEMQAHPILLIS